MSFDEHLASIRESLAVEARGTGMMSIPEITERQARRMAIREQIAQLFTEIHRATVRLEQLPALPDLICIRWAQNMLAYPNGRLLIVDTVFPAEAASVVQVSVLDFAGQVRLGQSGATGSRLASGEPNMPGISAKRLQEAVPLPELWPALLKELNGCYVLADDVRQAQAVLEQEAERFQLEPPLLIGDSVLPWYARFYQASGLIGLASLCHLIGYPLPPCPTITERALGQLALLQAMARGVTRAHTHELETTIDNEQDK
jgi:hypothetical protein